MGRAEWRRRADDPKGPLGWWWRGVWENGWPVYVLPGLGLWGAMSLGLPSVAVVGTGLLILAQTFRAVRAPDRLQALLPDPAPEGQFRGTVEYRRDGLVTGRDEMALTVVDGWLVGEGLRSHFALRSLDVRRLRTTSYGARLLLEDGGEVRLLGVLDLGRAELGRWHDDEILPGGEPTFPPARAHPQEIARWGGMLNLSIVLIFIPQGLLSLFFPTLAYAEMKLALAFLGFLLFALGSRALNRLMALSKTEEPSLSRSSDLECGDSLPLGSGASAPQIPLTSEIEARMRR